MTLSVAIHWTSLELNKKVIIFIKILKYFNPDHNIDTPIQYN